MKKKYEKPIVIIEAFQLDAAYAANCSSKGYIPINHDENSCTYDNHQFFNWENCQVDLVTTSYDVNDTHCYHGPILTAGQVFIYS